MVWGEREAVRRNDADRRAAVDEAGWVEGLRVDDGGIDIGVDLEVVRDPRVVGRTRTGRS